MGRLGIRKGDWVFIEKSGEIIPQVIKVITEKRTGHETPFVFPVNCPECQTKLVKPESEAVTRCPNPDCPAKLREGTTPLFSTKGHAGSMVSVRHWWRNSPHYARRLRIMVSRSSTRRAIRSSYLRWFAMQLTSIT
jgi:hypothetical protein